MIILFKAYFGKKNSEEVCPKIYTGKDPDPDPDVFKCRIRIRSKIFRIRNTARYPFCSDEISDVNTLKCTIAHMLTFQFTNKFLLTFTSKHFLMDQIGTKFTYFRIRTILKVETRSAKKPPRSATLIREYTFDLS
jgi:hypothetical protein